MIAGGTVTLSAGVGRGRLALKVTNPVDPGSPARPGTGTGLQNLRQRLVALYGNEAQLKTGVEHGTHSALVTLPADRGQDD
jgi:LytS/YehU family sensor histidine kinase